MKIARLVLVLAALASSAAAAETAARPEPPGLPPALQRFLRTEPPRKGWRVDASKRPAFLAGDFFGAGETTYAVPLLQTSGHGADVLFYRADGSTRRLSRDVNASLAVVDWKLYARTKRVPVRNDINQDMDPKAERHPKLTGDGIEFEKPYSSRVLAYWSKGRFRLYWLAD